MPEKKSERPEGQMKKKTNAQKKESMCILCRCQQGSGL